MEQSGVFAVARSVWDDADFPDEVFSQREAWIWLLSAAAWRPLKVRRTSGPVPLKRGEFCHSLRFLSERWGWQKGQVERFLASLKKRDMIQDTSRDGEKIYNIRKYNEFQVVGLPKTDGKQDTDRDSTGTAPGHEQDKEETLKHSNIEVSKKVEAPAVAVAPRSKPLRGTRWPDNQAVPLEWITEARDARSQDNSPPIDLEYEARRFQNYWASKAGGAAALKVDWRKTWLNWATDKEKTGNGRAGNSKQRAAIDQHMDGFAEILSDIRQGNVRG